jgi:hypothetical protein
MSIPPLVTKLIEIAGHRNVSILDAAQQIKASKEATFFRRWLAELQIALAEGTTPGNLDALRLLSDVKRAAVRIPAWTR